MKKLLVFLFILCISVTAWGMGEKPGFTQKGTPKYAQVEDQYYFTQKAVAEAIKNSTAENVKKAFSACSDLRMLFPEDNTQIAKTYFLAGRLYVDQKEYSNARGSLNKFLETVPPTENLDTEKAETQYLLGKIFQEKGNLSDAIAEYDKVEQLYPQETKSIIKARQGKAECYEKQGKFPETIKILEDTLQKYPADNYTQAYSYLKMALLSQKMGSDTKAEEYYQKLLALPDTPDIKGPRGVAKIALEQLKKK